MGSTWCVYCTVYWCSCKRVYCMQKWISAPKPHTFFPLAPTNAFTYWQSWPNSLPIIWFTCPRRLRTVVWESMWTDCLWIIIKAHPLKLNRNAQTVTMCFSGNVKMFRVNPNSPAEVASVAGDSLSPSLHQLQQAYFLWNILCHFIMNHWLSIQTQNTLWLAFEKNKHK